MRGRDAIRVGTVPELVPGGYTRTDASWRRQRARHAPYALAMFTLRVLGSASLDGPDGPVAGRAALRQRIALLALLAVEHPRPLSRDKLVADLWPESGTDDARRLLRESLYILRSALGDDSVLSTGDDLRLNPDRLTCDLWEFEAALARDDPEAAVSVYHGPFLSGFHLSMRKSSSAGWMASGRAWPAGTARRWSSWRKRETRGGDRLRAVEWWSRLAAEDPYNSRVALRYMQALEAAGDRAGALRHASAHSELLRSDLDAARRARWSRWRNDSGWSRGRLGGGAGAGPTTSAVPPRSMAMGAEPRHLRSALGPAAGTPPEGCTHGAVLALVVGAGRAGRNALARADSGLAPQRVPLSPSRTVPGGPTSTSSATWQPTGSSADSWRRRSST